MDKIKISRLKVLEVCLKNISFIFYDNYKQTYHCLLEPIFASLKNAIKNCEFDSGTVISTFLLCFFSVVNF